MSDLAIRLIQLVSCMATAYCAGFMTGRDKGRKQEHEATQSLWYTWLYEGGILSYTLNQFAGALTDGEHRLPREEQVKTSRYLDVTKPRDK